MRQTTNYQLPSWDSEDRILRTDFNELTEKTDAALKANASAISSEASTRSSAVSSLTTKLNKKGNVKVEIQTYVGTGEYGAAYSNSLTFSSRPLLFFIGGSNDSAAYQVEGCKYLYVRASAASACYGSWNGNTYSWYGSDVNRQMNESGKTYTVIAFFQCEE